MCGICGVYNFAAPGRPAGRDLIRAMTDRMAARGPDDTGEHFDGPLGLGFRRLSIVDLSPAGHQPMCDETGSLWLVLNGEIYNYPRLRWELQARGHALRSASDAEAVLHLYQDYGTDCVSHLDGMFSFALWDPAKKLLLLARDRLGIKPLYHHSNGEHAASIHGRSTITSPCATCRRRLPWSPVSANCRPATA
jgi:asparagine synthase (glutamine-hydrolysing)